MNKIWNSRYLDQLDYPTQYEFIAVIFRSGLLKKFRSGTDHIHVCSLSQSPRVIKCQALPWNKKSCLGVLTKLPIIPACFLNIHSERALYYLLRGLLSNQCQHILALPLLLLNFQHSELEKRRWCLSWSIFPICPSLVVKMLDLSLLDISIWTWEWNSSWEKTRALCNALFC